MTFIHIGHYETERSGTPYFSELEFPIFWVQVEDRDDKCSYLVQNLCITQGPCVTRGFYIIKGRKVVNQLKFVRV